jgi:hypothetical protein
MVSPAIAKLLTVKVGGTIVLGVTLAGGAAAAATTVAASSGQSAQRTAATVSASSHPHTKKAAPRKPAMPGVWGLCRAYLAQAEHAPKATTGTRKTPPPSPFAGLIKAAGGVQNVVPDCTRLLAGHHRANKPGTGPAKPAQRPTHSAAQRPTVAPTDHAQSDKPTSRPSHS